MGRSPRQLERLTLTYFGLAPKALLRRQRFLRSFAAIREHPPGLWGRLIDPGYVDQSQFVREFRYFMGMPARAYFAREHSFMRARHSLDPLDVVQVLAEAVITVIGERYRADQCDEPCLLDELDPS